ncbi:MAG: hypothetical protein NT061_02135 [Spirochaetes bacterium]|nr:hypothetical protein [Spirochaetota bacterium]
MCYFCGEIVSLDRVPGFGETCPTCGKDMHVCLMCSFYSPQARWACHETIETQVLEKDKRNYCDFFMLSPRFGARSPGDLKGKGKAEAARSAFGSLFKSS